MKYLILMLLIGCSVRKPRTSGETVWKSARGNILVFKADLLTYTEKGCHISGTYTKTYNNYLDWDIAENTCFEIFDLNSCYFAKNSYGEHGNFVCFDLGLSETFYRVK